jgi:hypothetical protein
MGTVSEYPEGAVEQYAAVASVMRRGLPWQISVLKLLARGHLPTDETLVHRAIRDILSDDDAGQDQDALSYAERRAEAATAIRGARPFLRAFRRNLLRAAPILEPGTDIDAVVQGVVATLTLAGMGQPRWSPEALVEMMAAYGIPVAEMTSEDRAGAARFMDSFLTDVTAGPALARTAEETPAIAIQAAVPAARHAVDEVIAATARTLPPFNEDIIDAMTAIFAVVQVRIEQIGGEAAITELVNQATGAV